MCYGLGSGFVFVNNQVYQKRFLAAKVSKCLHILHSFAITIYHCFPLFTTTSLPLPSHSYHALPKDGGDIFYVSWDEGVGEVRVQLAGSCSGCPSSSVTLKSGVENMLMHYIPEVR